MVTSKNLATEVSDAGERFIETLGKCLMEAQTTCPAEEFERFKKAVGLVIGSLEVDLLWPLYRQHPELEPESLRDWNNET